MQGNCFTRNPFIVAIILVLIFSYSCTSYFLRAAPLTIPAPDQVDRIVVSWQDSLDIPVVSKKIINDPDQIAQVIGFLKAHNRGWQKPETADPVGPYTVTFEHNGHVLFIIWIGFVPWIGGRNGDQDGKDNRYIIISPEDWHKLHEFLGVPIKEPHYSSSH